MNNRFAEKGGLTPDFSTSRWNAWLRRVKPTAVQCKLGLITTQNWSETPKFSINWIEKNNKITLSNSKLCESLYEKGCIELVYLFRINVIEVIFGSCIYFAKADEKLHQCMQAIAYKLSLDVPNERWVFICKEYASRRPVRLPRHFSQRLAWQKADISIFVIAYYQSQVCNVRLSDRPPPSPFLLVIDD